MTTHDTPADGGLVAELEALVSDDLTRLRNATEDDVTAALEGSYVQLPLTKPDEVLEAFKRIVGTSMGRLNRDA